jgi:hypothetical protein
MPLSGRLWPTALSISFGMASLDPQKLKTWVFSSAGSAGEKPAIVKRKPRRGAGLASDMASCLMLGRPKEPRKSPALDRNPTACRFWVSDPFLAPVWLKIVGTSCRIASTCESYHGQAFAGVPPGSLRSPNEDGRFGCQRVNSCPKS